MILSTIDCYGPLSVSVTGLGRHCGYLKYWDLGSLTLTLGQQMKELPGFVSAFFVNKWQSNTNKHIQEGLHYNSCKKKKAIKLHFKKEQALIDAAFYVLLSARRVTLQKITVVLTQAESGLQAGACKKCQAKGIYLVTRLLPPITQHYCLCSAQPKLKIL